MNKGQERLIFECLSVLLEQESICTNPDYQKKLVSKCNNFTDLGDKE